MELVLWLLFGGMVGALIGQRKSRTGAGVLFGLLLGPIGWLLVALGPDVGPKCPECAGSIEANVRRCRHCGSVLQTDSPSGVA